jgi:hypothetical protein
MLTICAYFDSTTLDLIPKIQELFASSDIQIIAYTPYGCNYEHPEVKVTNVSGFKCPQTSILLEASNEVEQCLFIFDIVGWVMNAHRSEKFSIEECMKQCVTLLGNSVKEDLDLETLYDDCFEFTSDHEYPSFECLECSVKIRSAIKTFLDAIHV